MTQARQAKPNDPAIQRVRAAWMSAHAPAPISVEKAQEDGRYIVRWRGDEITEATRSALFKHNISIISEAADGMERSAIISPLGNLKTALDLAAAVQPEPIPQHVVIALMHAHEDELPLKDNRVRIIEWVRLSPPDSTAIDWLVDRADRYNEAVERAHDWLARNERIRAERLHAEEMARAIDVNSTDEDTAEVSPVSELDAMRAELAEVRRQLEIARAELTLRLNTAAEHAKLIAELRTTNEHQSNLLKERVVSSGGMEEHGFVLLDLPPTTDKSKPGAWDTLGRVLAQGWQVQHEEFDLKGNRYAARVSRRVQKRAPLELREIAPVRYIPSPRTDSDRLIAEALRSVVQRAAEIREGFPHIDLPDAPQENPFTREEVA